MDIYAELRNSRKFSVHKIRANSVVGANCIEYLLATIDSHGVARRRILSLGGCRFGWIQGSAGCACVVSSSYYWTTSSAEGLRCGGHGLRARPHLYRLLCRFEGVERGTCRSRL